MHDDFLSGLKCEAGELGRCLISLHLILFSTKRRQVVLQPSRSQRPLTRADFPFSRLWSEKRECPYPWKGRPELRCLLTSLSALWRNPLKTRANRQTLHALFFNTVHSCSPGVTSHWAIIGVFSFFRGKRKTQNNTNKIFNSILPYFIAILVSSNEKKNKQYFPSYT